MDRGMCLSLKNKKALAKSNATFHSLMGGIKERESDRPLKQQ